MLSFNFYWLYTEHLSVTYYQCVDHFSGSLFSSLCSVSVFAACFVIPRTACVVKLCVSQFNCVLFTCSIFFISKCDVLSVW